MSGKIVTTLGVMGAGKTKRLIETYNSVVASGLRAVVFRPNIDTRDVQDVVRSRDGQTAPAVSISNIDEAIDHGALDFQVILFDEIQFFNDGDVSSALTALSLLGLDIYCYGLDMTSEGNVFGQVGSVMAVSDEVRKITCKCSKCGVNPARHSAYKGGVKKYVVVVGDLDSYEPLCRDCFYFDEQMEDFADSDPLHFITLGGEEEGFSVEMAVKNSTLVDAGYTVEDVKEVSTLEGVANLLEDLGLTEQGGESYE